MSSTVPPAEKSEEAFEPDTWDIPELMPDAGVPANSGQALPRSPARPVPGLPLQRTSPGVAPASATTPGAASVRQPESAQRAADAQSNARVPQPPPLPRQRQTSTGPGAAAPAAPAPAAPAPAAPAPAAAPASATSADARKAQAAAQKDWSLLDPHAGARPPGVEKPVKPERTQAPAVNVRRTAQQGPPTSAKSPVQSGSGAAKSAPSITERPQATAVPPPARHASAEEAVPVARPAAPSPTLQMPAVSAAMAASARRQQQEAWELDEPPPTTVVAPPPSKPAQTTRTEGPKVREVSAAVAAPEPARGAAVDAPKPASQPRVADVPLAKPIQEAKAVEAPKPPAQEAKVVEAPRPPSTPKVAEAPPPRPAVETKIEAKIEAPVPKPAAPARVEAKAPVAETPKARPVPEARTVEPPPVEPRISRPPPEDVGWLAPIVESGASLDDIERREASVLLDFDSDLLPSAVERDQSVPGRSSGESVCTFWLGHDCFGLDVQLVSEVLLIDDILPVPWAPPALLGLFNSRGRIVPVVNLAALLGLDPGPPEPHGAAHASPAILIKADSLVAAALIDRPGLVVQINRGAVTPTERGSAEPWVKGHLRLDERSHPAVTLLDPESLVQRFLDMSRFPDIRTCLGSGGYRPARAKSAKNSEGDIS